MTRVVHFDIPVDDVKRAQKFYSEIFGCEFEKWDGPIDYWLVKTDDDKQHGINGGMMKRERVAGETGVTNVIDVSSVDEFSKKIQSKGGKIIAPKMPIQGVGYIAHCADTGGNVFGIIEFDKDAIGEMT
jgi:predicted enzyme related to lactoylglutathione lyase